MWFQQPCLRQACLPPCNAAGCNYCAAKLGIHAQCSSRLMHSIPIVPCESLRHADSGRSCMYKYAYMYVCPSIRRYTCIHTYAHACMRARIMYTVYAHVFLSGRRMCVDASYVVSRYDLCCHRMTMYVYPATYMHRCTPPRRSRRCDALRISPCCVAYITTSWGSSSQVQKHYLCTCRCKFVPY